MNRTLGSKVTEGGADTWHRAETQGPSGGKNGYKAEVSRIPI
jgi:hypothetical protein